MCFCGFESVFVPWRNRKAAHLERAMRNDLGCGMGVWVLPVITTSSIVIKNAGIT